MPELSTIYDYMRAHAGFLGSAHSCRSIQRSTNSTIQFHLGLKGCCERLFLHRPSRSWELAKRWQQARTGMVVAECGTGKTLISLGAIHVHSEGSPFTALAMVPPHLVEKWAREAFLTLPGVRVFLIDDLRNGGDENKAARSERSAVEARPHRAGRLAYNVERIAAAEGFAEFPETLVVALRETIAVYRRT